MTAEDLIKKSLQLINVIAAGQTPAPEELDDGLVVLNNLVASWNAQQIPLYQVASQTVALTGAPSYTLTARVARIKTAEVVTTVGVSAPATLVDAVGWTRVMDKTRTGIFAESLFCDYGFPNATVRLSPNPATGSLVIWAYTPLTQFASLSATISLPDGYERALRYNLAVDLAAEYGRTVTPEVSGIANESKNAITGLNATVLGESANGGAATTQAA